MDLNLDPNDVTAKRNSVWFAVTIGLSVYVSLAISTDMSLLDIATIGVGQTGGALRPAQSMPVPGRGELIASLQISRRAARSWRLSAI
jgi:hypothetical protein